MPGQYAHLRTPPRVKDGNRAVSGEAVVGWRSAQLALPSLPSPSAIVMEGNANNGGFALDDLRLTPIGSEDACETR